MSGRRVFISAAVGREGRNHFTDVRAVQALINHHLPPTLHPLAEDGRCGPLTIGAIEEVERLYIHMPRPDGRLDPHGPTLRALNSAQPARRNNAARVPVAPMPPASRPQSPATPHRARPLQAPLPRAASMSHPPAPAGGVITPGITPAAVAAAQAAQRRWGVPASITLAQYIQESSAGRHMPAGSNNPFGMKASHGQPFVTARTREEVRGGGSVYIMARFRKFDSIEQAFDAHGHSLATGRAYALARQHGNDADAYADALTHHYATDSHYGSALKGIMRRHSLYQYNNL